MFNHPPSKIRVAILDDHAIVRHGILSFLEPEPDLEIVGVYEKSRELIADLGTNPVDVLLIDYSLGPDDIDGPSLIRALSIKYPDSRILILSSHFNPAIVKLAFGAGARGFIGKCQNLRELSRAIRTLHAGLTYLNDDMAYQISATSFLQQGDVPDGQESQEQDPIGGSACLSPREREVIRCFLDGMTVGEIAKKFGRSIKTISTQKSAAFRKLGIRSDNQLFKIKHMLDKG